MHQLCHRFGFLAVLALAANLSSFAQCPFPKPVATNILNYSFEPIVAGDKMSLRVTLTFRGAANGRARLKLPSEWAGQRHAENSVTDIQMLTPATTIEQLSSPAEKELHFPPNSVVRISYVLVKDWDGRLDSGTRFRADLSPQYFHLIGATSLVHPAFEDVQVVDVHFDWQRLPAEWSLATSFGTGDRCQSFHGLWHYALHSLLVGGDYRIHRTEIAGNSVNFAIRGSWSFSDEEWIRQASKIVEFERTFWRDNDFPYFLITLTPLDQDHGSSGGTALTNAFMEHLSRLDELNHGVLGILAHETFHAWNPYKTGLPHGSGYAVSWFYEGFTHYYQDLMLFRAGLLNFPDYVVSVNEGIRKYALNEGVNVSLAEFVHRHSADNSVLNQLDYRRGMVLALWLDATIRQRSHNRASLDDVMFDLVRQESAHLRGRDRKPLRLTNHRIFAAVTPYLGRQLTGSLRRYVEQGGIIPIPEGAIGTCVRARTDLLARFDPGFDASRLNNGNKIVAGVETESEAYRAGLRNGQELLHWSIHNGDTSQEVRLTLKADDGERVLTYLPQGGRMPVQQFAVDQEKYRADPGMCAKAQ